MSSRSRQTIRGGKTPAKGAKGKAGRRAAVKSSTDIPVMAVVVGAILLVAFVGILIYGIRNHNSTSFAPSVKGSSATIPCDNLEHTQVHYHTAIQIMDSQGTLHPIPGGVGIVGDETAPTCYYWLHVHSANQDVIHIESPSQDVFTLGDFFKVWNAWSTFEGGPSERLDTTHVSTLTVDTGQQMVVYIDLNDGKGPQVYSGDPAGIRLKSHETVTIEIVSGKPVTPPSFDWNSQANQGL